MRSQLVFAFVPFTLIGQIQPVRTVTSQAQLVGNQPIPGFHNGYLYFFDGAAVRVYSPEGWPALTTVLQIPSAEDIRANGLGVDPGGDFAIGVSYRSSALMGGIAFFSKDGQPDGFVATGSYVPMRLCFADDHSLWTFGAQRGAGDYMTVRHYSASRKDTGEFLARSLFPKGLEPGTGNWQSSRIWVAKDRVGLWAYSGIDGGRNEWVELDFSGKLIRRLRVDQAEFTPMAFTTDGRLYRKRDHKSPLQMLSQTTSEWQDAGMATLGTLLGSDGNSLVFSSGVIGPITMRWFSQPTVSGDSIVSLR